MPSIVKNMVLPETFSQTVTTFVKADLFENGNVENGMYL